MKRYATFQDVQRRHRAGFAVKHDPLPLLEGAGSPSCWYTWHRKRRAAWAELRRGGMAGDERVIRVWETDLYLAERNRLLALRSERRRKRRSGLLPPAR